MKIVSRRFVVLKPLEIVSKILQTCAYPVPAPIITGNNFSMVVSFRRNGRLHLLRVKGTLLEKGGKTVVNIGIYNALYSLVCLLFFLAPIAYAIVYTWKWTLFFCCVLFGAISISIPMVHGVEIIDLIEFKLTRRELENSS